MLKRSSVVTVISLAFVIALVAHPHFRKTVTAELPGGVTATISYQTTPANESLAENAEVGQFLVPRGPQLSLSGDVTAGSVQVAAGDYTIGVIKNGSADWTLGLYPGRLQRGATPDMNQVIKLDSAFSEGEGTADHMLIDITPGSGELEGKTVLTLHFGSLFLAGVIG